MGRKRDEINVHFIGGSATQVTGSCVIITYPKNDNSLGTIALEMGMIQGEPTIQKEYNANKNIISKIPFKDIEYCFLGHCHVDHIGLLGACLPNGFNGKILSSYETIELSKKLLMDCAYIHKSNVDKMKFKGKKVKELFTEADTYELFNKMESYETDEIIKLNDNLSFRFSNNNHCLGAIQIELFFKTPSNKVKKIVYTSDIGSEINQPYRPYLKEMKPVANANLLIMESTYGEGDRCFTKKEAKQEREDLNQTITDIVSKGNRVLIPVFSFNRAQEMMTLIYEKFKDEEWFDEIPVVVDSKLLNEINQTYLRILKDEDLKKFEEVMSWRNFKFITNYKNTQAFLSKKVPCVILSSSGFGDSGHVVEYIRNVVTYKNDAILIVGYAPQESLSSKVLNEDAKVIKIDKETLGKRCKSKRYLTFTSHISQKELVNYMKQINTDKIVLHHGSKEAKDSLKNLSKEELSKIGKTTPIITSEKDMIVTI